MTIKMKRGTFTNKDFENEIKSFSYSSKFRYILLSRMKSDCDYYLYATRSQRNLWAGNEEAHIKDMISLYLSLAEKPKWFTVKELDAYSVKMTGWHLKKFGVKIRF